MNARLENITVHTHVSMITMDTAVCVHLVIIYLEIREPVKVYNCYIPLFTMLYYYILLYAILYYYVLLHDTICYYILLCATIYYYILLYTTILVCDRKHWGVECSGECRCADYTTICHPETGCEECVDGWTGGSCQEDINECLVEDDVCGDHGICTNHEGGYTCSCELGWGWDYKQCFGRTKINIFNFPLRFRK